MEGLAEPDHHRRQEDAVQIGHRDRIAEGARRELPPVDAAGRLHVRAEPVEERLPRPCAQRGIDAREHAVRDAVEIEVVDRQPLPLTGRDELLAQERLAGAGSARDADDELTGQDLLQRHLDGGRHVLVDEPVLHLDRLHDARADVRQRRAREEHVRVDPHPLGEADEVMDLLVVEVGGVPHALHDHLGALLEREVHDHAAEGEHRHVREVVERLARQGHAGVLGEQVPLGGVAADADDDAWRPCSR